MAAPMPTRKFKKLLKKYGCTMEPTTKHMGVIDAKGNRIYVFPITHPGNYVLECYWKQFLKLMKDDVTDSDGDIDDCDGDEDE